VKIPWIHLSDSRNPRFRIRRGLHLDESCGEIVSQYPMKGGVRIHNEAGLNGIVSECRFRYGIN